MANLKGFKKAMDKYGATKLTLLGMAAFTLVILLLVTIFATFPRMDNFIEFYTQEYQCSIQANADYAECTSSNELDIGELPEICEGRYCLDDQSCCERFDPGEILGGREGGILGGRGGTLGREGLWVVPFLSK